MNLTTLLQTYQGQFASVVPIDFQADTLFWFDFSENNPELAYFDLGNIAQMNEYVFGRINDSGAKAGLGGYAEDRSVYQKSQVFSTTEGARSIHLGIDVWMQALTYIYSPWEGKVHSFQDNANFGDYGPTIILEHTLEGVSFYTLYGHLTRASLESLEEGQIIQKGQKIGEIGDESENGHWTPHLHFQVIGDMLGRKGDFIGVAARSEKDYYLGICPDPGFILNARM